MSSPVSLPVSVHFPVWCLPNEQGRTNLLAIVTTCIHLPSGVWSINQGESHNKYILNLIGNTVLVCVCAPDKYIHMGILTPSNYIENSSSKQCRLKYITHPTHQQPHYPIPLTVFRCFLSSLPLFILSTPPIICPLWLIVYTRAVL